MQVSLVARSHPRPNFDDRPKFTVVIIYEDGAAGKRAKIGGMIDQARREGSNRDVEIAAGIPVVSIDTLIATDSANLIDGRKQHRQGFAPVRGRTGKDNHHAGLPTPPD